MDSASLVWQRGPGDISHYRMEVKGDGMDLKENLSDLTFDLGNLTSGTLHSVQVFPVKCERDLNPQSTTFYTSELHPVNVVSRAAVLQHIRGESTKKTFNDFIYV